MREKSNDLSPAMRKKALKAGAVCTTVREWLGAQTINTQAPDGAAREE